MTEDIIKQDENIPVKPKITRRKSVLHRPVRQSVSEAPVEVRPERSKPKRVKFNDRNRISFSDLDPNYVYRVVNDKAGRIARMQEIGYEFVESDEQLGDYRVAEGSKMGKAVSKPVGGGINGYLMRIKKEFYEEDRKEKDRRVDDVEAALKPKKDKGEYGTGLTNE